MVRIALGHRSFALLFGLCFLALSLGASDSRDAGARWVSAYSEMERGHGHWLADEYGDAASRFRGAIAGFEGILRDYPTWRTDLVLFRLAYCRVKLGECESQLSSFEHEEDAITLRELLRRERERNHRLAVELERLDKAGNSSLAQVKGELGRLRDSYETLSGRFVRQTHAFSVNREALTKAEGELARLRKAKDTFTDVLGERDDLRERVKELEVELVRKGKEAVSSASEAHRAWRDRALKSEVSGDGASAARYWQLCAEAGGNALECWTRSAYYYWQVGEREKSRESLARLFAAMSETGRYWTMLSRVCLSLGERERSLGLAAMSVASRKDGADELVSLSACLMGMGARGLSERYLRQALSVSPSHKEALWCMATVLSTLGQARKDEARGYYERALKAGLSHDAGLDAYFGMSTQERSGK